VSFATDIEFDGRLLWWGLEVCTAGDDFATVQYRWATMAGDVGANHFQERIVSMGNIQRGLGNDHLPVASTVELVIDNTDFAADFLVNRATVETSVFKARFRLLCGVDDGTTNTYQANLVTQQVGVFVCLDFPERNAASIRLSLTDDALGKLSDLLTSPTLADWRQDPNNTPDNAPWDFASPYGNELTALTDFNTPHSAPVRLRALCRVAPATGTGRRACRLRPRQLAGAQRTNLFPSSSALPATPRPSPPTM